MYPIYYIKLTIMYQFANRNIGPVKIFNAHDFSDYFAQAIEFYLNY